MTRASQDRPPGDQTVLDVAAGDGLAQRPHTCILSNTTRVAKARLKHVATPGATCPPGITPSPEPRAALNHQRGHAAHGWGRIGKNGYSHRIEVCLDGQSTQAHDPAGSACFRPRGGRGFTSTCRNATGATRYANPGQMASAIAESDPW